MDWLVHYESSDEEESGETNTETPFSHEGSYHAVNGTSRCQLETRSPPSGACRGKWLGHVFVKLPYSPVLRELIEASMTIVERNGLWEPHDVNELHLSLSRPFHLQRGQIGPFVTALEKELYQRLGMPSGQYCPRGGFDASTAVKIEMCNVQSPMADALNEVECERENQPSLDLALPRCLRLVSNDTGTRHFLTWPVLGTELLHRYVAAVDQVLSLYRQPPYYPPDPYFHVSIAASSSPTTNKKLRRKDKAVVHSGTDQGRQRYLRWTIDEIECVFGGDRSSNVYGESSPPSPLRYTIPLQRVV
jgi:Uncharacterised conserved protein